ncbi:MAG: family 78 glycoside hydrolase catalytic domain [Oscillospiraceae bacterium]|nr:family 78 glycoside hydrolase catalytic domain [Oscillospiraceae bacterium]
MKAVHLRVCALEDPIGLGNRTPEFSWHVSGGVRQRAYRIKAERNGSVIWDTGKVCSDRMNGIIYDGEELRSRDMVSWEVTLWDENSKPGETSSGSFEMGLLDREDWSAQWITGDYKPGGRKRYPVDCFRREFELREVPAKARLYASARGVYDVTINGKRLEQFILAPGITDYRKRIQYQTYDVDGILRQGKNVIELRLADGWYRGSSAAYGVTNVYGKQTSAIAQLEIDGRAVIITDKTFLWSNDGPVRFADLKDGETVDSRLSPSYSGRAVIAAGSAELVASDNVYVREKESFSAKLVKRDGNRYVFDFSQNIAGYVSFRIDARNEQTLELTCAETLDRDGNIDMSGIQLPRPRKGWSRLGIIKTLLGNPPKKDVVMTPLQKVNYICKDGENEYKTSFSVFGFRYMEVLTDAEIDENCFKAIAVYSDMEQTGDFSCSSELVNRFVSNVRWSMKSNFLDIPTDCPTRERLGWTGDAQIFFGSASFLMDVRAFFSKWLRDMEDAQKKSGVIPAVLPYEGVSEMYDATGTSVGWADAVYLIPYRYYQRYRDRTVLDRSWPMIKRYAEFLFSHLGFRDRKQAKADPENNRYVYEKGVHLGEWLEPEEFRDSVYGTRAKHPEEGTAYLHLAMKSIAEIAGIMGDDELKRRCEETADGSRETYNRLFVKDGTIDTDRQAKLVRPLALGLLDGAAGKNVRQRLVKALEDYRFRVGTGFLSTPFLLPVLQDAGETETAYRVLLNEEAPGWLSEVVQGATTVWENWEGNLSLNHYSPGAALEWLFSGVLGIDVRPENRIVIAPCLSRQLDHAEGEYLSIYGNISVGWEAGIDGFTVSTETPANTDSVLRIGAKEIPLTPGKHTFVTDGITVSEL